jgi:hypothetical protein
MTKESLQKLLDKLLAIKDSLDEEYSKLYSIFPKKITNCLFAAAKDLDDVIQEILESLKSI